MLDAERIRPGVGPAMIRWAARRVADHAEAWPGDATTEEPIVADGSAWRQPGHGGQTGGGWSAPGAPAQGGSTQGNVMPPGTPPGIVPPRPGPQMTGPQMAPPYPVAPPRPPRPATWPARTAQPTQAQFNGQPSRPGLTGPQPAAGSWWSDALTDPWRNPDAVAVVINTPPSDVPPLEKPAEPGPAPRVSLGLALVMAIVVALLAGGLGGTLGYAFATGNGATIAGTNLGANAPLANRPPESIAGLAKKVLPSVVTISVRVGSGAALGSGFVVSPDGYVITNNHVVAGATGDPVVRFTDGQVAQATVVGSDPEADVSVIKIDKTGLPDNEIVPVEIGNSDQLQVGDPVLAVGSPLGLSSTVTSGIVSYIDRPIHTSEGGTPRYYAAIQTDAAVNQGNSGGPLFNAAGQAVGINSVIGTLSADQDSAGNVGLAFAIPINQAKRLAQEIIDTGKARRTVMGASFSETFRSQSGGAQISTVAAGGPAATAGLKAGDVLLAVNKRPIDEAPDATALIRKYAPGDTVQVDYLRGTGRQSASVTLAADAN
jgi:putative serine protease PepD